jgi:hypothetical protein
MNTLNPNSAKKWTLTQKVLFRFVFIFILFRLISFPFPYNFLPDIGKYVAPLFVWLSGWCGTHILHLNYSCTYLQVSDSTGMYITLLILFCFAFFGTIIWTVLDKERQSYNTLFYAFMVIIRYYLATQLLIYGFDKVFKRQFYLPEPNTLYTPIGNVPSALLYWSTMGLSRLYTVFCGIIEVIPAFLLLFRRTALLGALMSLGVMLNVVVINFSYDINVKLHSIFLLLLGIIIAAPHAESIFRFFMGLGAAKVNMSSPEYYSKKMFRLYAITKIAVIAFILSALLYPTFQTKNFNDDTAERPLLHGAYSVITFIKNKDTIPALTTDISRWERVFVHRRGYFITENMNDIMKDFSLEYDTAKHLLFVKRYNDTAPNILNYTKTSDTTLLLSGKFEGDSLKVTLKKLDLNKLPALQQGFHWTIDY